MNPNKRLFKAIGWKYPKARCHMRNGEILKWDDPDGAPQPDEQTLVDEYEAAGFVEPGPLTPADVVEQKMKNDPFTRAWVKRQARIESKTPKQIIDEIKADA